MAPARLWNETSIAYSLMLVGGSSLVLAWIIKVLVRAFRRDLRAIPGPALSRFSRLYRLSMVAKGQAPQEYRKLHAQYGPVVRVGPNHVSISDPAAIPVIYGVGSRFYKVCKIFGYTGMYFYKTMVPLYKGSPMDSMFTARDPAVHKTIKSSVAGFFSMTSMHHYESAVEECTDIFLAAMRDIEGQTFDLAIWLQWYAFDVIAGITFNRRFGFLDERKDVNTMIERLDTGLDVVKILGQYPEWQDLAVLILRNVMRLVGIEDPLVQFVKLCEEEIQRYDEATNTAQRTDFLSQLRQKQDKLDPVDSHRGLINHLSNNLLAGSDTTAISLRACFYYLIHNPRVLECLRTELREADALGKISNPVTLDESLRLPYLQAVMKEAMRLHPGVGFPLERKVPDTGATISGYALAPGTNVAVMAPVVQIDKAVFGDDAESFRPERWLEVEREQLNVMDRSMLMFGHGTRTCIGKNISLMEMGKFIPQVLRFFDIEWTSEKDTWDTNAAWFWKQSNMQCKFKVRDGF